MVSEAVVVEPVFTTVNHFARADVLRKVDLKQMPRYAHIVL
jgi:hypothetical protein